MHQSELLARIWRAIDVEISSQGHGEMKEEHRLLGPDEMRVVPGDLAFATKEQPIENLPCNQHQNALQNFQRLLVAHKQLFADFPHQVFDHDLLFR